MSADATAVIAMTDAIGGPPLCCVPAVSGSPYPYLPLARLLDDQPVVALEAPGFEDDRPPAGSLAELSAGYVEALRQARPGPAYALLGWSMGGVVALDMAHRLRRAGARVPALILVDSALPTAMRHPVGLHRVARFVVDLLAAGGVDTAAVASVLATLPVDTRPGAAFAALGRAGVLPEDLDGPFLDSRYRLFEAHLSALIAHRPVEGYPGPVTVVRAAETPADLMRWERIAGNVTQVVVPGDHYSIWRGGGLAALSTVVRRILHGIRRTDAASDPDEPHLDR
ncbi:alpha/beta fold hydrolase [Micromonospora sp. NPDC002296]|uniref:thioesterase domain-containing protein n=1 Tax=Micromonospora sp. NPDC002296 TaxID=3154271 RepID=UPI00331F1BFE